MKPSNAKLRNHPRNRRSTELQRDTRQGPEQLSTVCAHSDSPHCSRPFLVAE